MNFPASLRILPLVGIAATGCTDQVPTQARPDAAAPALYTAPSQPVNGEFIRTSAQSTVYLVYNQTLYAIPDMQTLRACTGGYENVVRVVPSLPAWQTRTLPSAGTPTSRPHGRAWIHGDRPVQASTGGTVFLLVGCVRAGIPTEAVYQSTFGDLNWSRVMSVAAADLNAFPQGPNATGFPVRRAGTLLNSGWVKWVTYHGGSLGVPDAATMDAYCRPWSDLINSSTEHNAYAQQWNLQGTSSACSRGNDYPYSGSSGTDPWNYFMRQCTSFAAWRLNQDGIEFHNQYRGVHFSDAHTWASRAQQAGLVVNNVPKKGAIAHWNAGAFGASSSGHVAYVAAVHNNGTVTIEDYNWTPLAYRRQTNVPVSQISNFIHFR